MTFISTCLPCQMGDHDNHAEVITVAPKGGLGGAMCGCKGDCKPLPTDLFDPANWPTPEEQQIVFRDQIALNNYVHDAKVDAVVQVLREVAEFCTSKADRIDGLRSEPLSRTGITEGDHS